MSTSPDFTSYKDPKIIGPGVWYFVHLKASEIKTKEDAISVHKDIDILRRRFACEACRRHFDAECQKNNPRTALNKDIKLMTEGKNAQYLAQWLVNSHNQANINKFENNKRLRTPNKTAEAVNIKYSDVKNFFNPSKVTSCVATECEPVDVKTSTSEPISIKSSSVFQHSTLLPNIPIVLNSEPPKIKFIKNIRKLT
jgi:hypothetical protein